MRVERSALARYTRHMLPGTFALLVGGHEYH